MQKILLIFIFLGGIFVFQKIDFAQELSGYEIMTEVFNRDDGQDCYFKIRMVLVDKRGYERERLLEIYIKDYGDLIKTYIKFLEPADIAGTSFLSWENETGDDTQYLYLPALGRARRIVSSQKNLRFVNTDFTYEDMQRRRPEKDEHRLLRQEPYNGYGCYVVESAPKDKDSQYSRRINWVDKASYVILRTDFYDKKGKKFKEFRVEELEEKEGIWTVMKTVMEDSEENHKTLMGTLEVEYNQGLDDEIFGLRHLEKG